MNYILFEDEDYSSLYPFTLTHPVFELRCGAFTNLERIEQFLTHEDSLTLLVREELENVTKSKYPAYKVNPETIQKGILLNSSCLWDLRQINQFSNGRSFTYNHKLMASCLENEIQFSQLDAYKSKAVKVTTEIQAYHIQYLWDSIFLLPNQISKDFSEINSAKLGDIHPSAVMVNDENIFLGENTAVNAGAILDADNGPVIIQNGTNIEIGALIQGPVIIGPNCTINPGAKIRGNVVLGPVCKVGGEIEDCIIHGFSNKQHDGFLGHSYIGEWVNLGANTNNSDLKNNYSSVKFSLNGELINTQHKFLGVMMGDYTRTGISTMFNTGTYVGVGANIFGHGFQSKCISSFQWGESGNTDLDKLLETCRIMKTRRNLTLEQNEEELLRHLYHTEVKNKDFTE